MIKKNRIRARIKYTAGSMIILSSLMGVGYAQWTDTLEINATVSSGNIELVAFPLSSADVCELVQEQKENVSVTEALKNIPICWGYTDESQSGDERYAGVYLANEQGRGYFKTDVRGYFVLKNTGTIPITLGGRGKEQLGMMTITREQELKERRKGKINLVKARTNQQMGNNGELYAGIGHLIEGNLEINKVDSDEISVIGQAGDYTDGPSGNNPTINLGKKAYILEPNQTVVLEYVEGRRNIDINLGKLYKAEEYKIEKNLFIQTGDKYHVEFEIPYCEAVTKQGKKGNGVWNGTLKVEFERNIQPSETIGEMQYY